MQSYITLAAIIGLCQSRSTQQAFEPAPVGNIRQPLIGFGTWNLKESEENTTNAVSLAIQAGYRQIDCAAAYGNEIAVGKGIEDGLKKAGLGREDIWITSKLWNDHHEPGRVEGGLSQTLMQLGVDYIDLYLMHWPVGKGPDDEKYHYDYLETWDIMIDLLKTRRTRYIGISNFSPAQLKDLLANSSVIPSVHQMELHPYLQQTEWIKAHQEHGIAVTAYSPLGNMNPTYGDRSRRSVTTQSKAPLLLENETIKHIAKARHCTPAQVVLSWGMQRGVSVIPKTKHEGHMKENLEAEKCVLEADDLQKIKELGDEPIRFNNPSKNWGVYLYEGLEDA